MATTSEGVLSAEERVSESASAQLPVLGAAMPLEKLPQHLEWLNASGRTLEIQDPILPAVLDGDWRGVAAKARTPLRDYQGVYGIHGPFIDLPLGPFDPLIRQVVSTRLQQGLEFAHEIGATHMVMHSPFLFFGSPFVPHSPAFGLASDIELVHAVLDPLLPLAEAAGCMLVIETIFDSNTAPLLALIRSFNSPLVRLSVDVGHVFIKRQVGGPTPDQWVAEAGDLLGHLHLTDNDGQYDRHWRPGRGNINWYALFEALGKSPAKPRLILELKDTDELPHAARWLHEQGLAR
jgi:sugar phosphate isomerase/epimerase